MREINKFLMLSLTVLIFSCNNKETQNDISNDDLDEIAESHFFFEDLCLHDIEKSFIEYDIWSIESKIVDACVFEPKISLTKTYCQNGGLYLRFTLKDSISHIREYYLYNECSQDFTPLHYTKNGLVLDTMFLVRVYFEGDLHCSNVKIRGSNSKDKKKNGVFKRSW